MAYTLKSTEPDLAQGMRRVAIEQLDRALSALDSPGEDPHESVHEARKCCKKLRGLLRLFRGAFPGYADENAALRDAARHLSGLRDKTAMIECYDRLMERYGAALERSAFAPLRAGFTRDRKAAVEAGDLGDRMAAMADALRTVRGRAEGWTLTEEGFDAIEYGLIKSYARARDAMEAAADDRDAEAMHEWRKRVKYHWYHMRLLSDAQSEPLAAREAAADRLSDLLGDHHDLVELGPRLESAPLGDVPTRVFRGLVGEEKARLEDEIFVLGATLFSRKPKKLGKDVARAVTTWYAAA
ncbi:CHAD domain protein [Roseivivax jejudonensis]|uniref:CHAD domain protein n=1 Tax=Roseivivax jejudonensis TaxID=1529041 RepID=A0A1X6YGE2_9RHOB|nr:CHAD domain-containing protein [Roseivivax jejudonensis]SLN20744.1 CHAD domain protein [Roseivivax jejudonensis]